MNAYREALLDLLDATRTEGIAIGRGDLGPEAGARQAEAMTAFLDLVPTELLRSDD